jgi:ketosteroid isomerase-like protein
MSKLWVAAVTVLALAGCPRQQVPVNEPTPATPDEVVRAASGMLEQYRQAYAVRSLDAIAPLYAQSLDVTITHQGKSHAGWSPVEKYLNELLGGTSQIHLTFDNPSIVALGPGGAAVTTAIRREVSDGVTTVVEEGTLTLALRREADRWVIVKEHFSYPPARE